MNQLLQLISIHFKEFFREPGIIFWAIIFPILMAWGLGIAFTKKGELVRTIAFVPSEVPQDILGNSWQNDEIIKEIGNEKLGVTKYRFKKVTWEEALLMLKKGKAALVIQQISDSVLYYFDPLNPEAQLSYLQVSSILDGRELPDHLDRVRPLTEVGVRYIDFLIPGLMAWGIMMSCMWGISYSLIDKRVKKLLRRMVATPMKKSYFLLAQFISRLSLGALESALLLLFAWMYFDIQIQGNVLALVIIFIAGNIAFTGIAILVSSRTENTQVGNGLINAVVMPMMIVSGIFFSYHNFPDWAIVVIQKLPLTILADNTRSIFIEGAGLVEILPATISLVVIGMVFFFTGLRFYKWY